MNQLIKLVNYSTDSWPFRETIETVLGEPGLENLHLRDGSPASVVETGKDNHTIWHDKFYNAMHSQYSLFMHEYNNFVEDFVRRYYEEPIVVQRFPTFRIHWRNNLSVGSYHKDSEYNHPKEEQNWWIPVTHAWGSNSIYLETDPDNQDHQPWVVNYGQALLFPGGALDHGNEINQTHATRVSFDFRVIPKAQYREDANAKAGVGHGKLRFVIGEYYRLIE